MAKSGFAFNLRQRVIVPNSGGAQGVIVKRVDQVRGEPSYYVETLTAQGLPAGGWVGETDLRSINP